MPPRPFAAGVCQVLFKGRFSAANNWLNKLFVSYGGPRPTATDLHTYAAALAADWTINITPMQAIATTLEEVEVTDLTDAVGAVGVFSGSTPGTRAGGDIPGSACALASYHLTRHYRGGHPRSYIAAGVTTDLLTQSTWKPAFVTDLQTGWRNVLAGLLVPAGAFTPAYQVNVSYFGGVPPVGGHSVARGAPIFDGIIGGATTISPEVASQRRRIGRH